MIERDARLTTLLQQWKEDVDKFGKKALNVEIEFKAEQKKYVERENRQIKYLQSDRLSFSDFYKMYSSVFSHPNALWCPWAFAVLLTGAYWAFGFAQLHLFGWGLEGTLSNYLKLYSLFVLFLYLLILPVPLIRAIKWMNIYRKLPFEVEGFGRLVHQCDDNRLEMKLCRINIILKKNNARAAENESEHRSLMNDIQKTMLQLIVSRANKYIAGNVLFASTFYSAKWSVEFNGTAGAAGAKGFMNPPLAGKLIALLSEKLIPLHQQTAVVEKIIVDIFEESVDISDD